MSTTKPVAHLYRMKTPSHVCPFGLKSRALLNRKGYVVDDHLLTSREETDAFKREHDVKTTPQTFIDGKRIGGYDALKEFFGQPVKDKDKKTYKPVIAIFASAALMALAVSWAAYGSLLTVRAAEWFIAISMCILAIQKLRDLESFSNSFLGYDLLAQKDNDCRRIDLSGGAGRPVHRHDWCGISFPCGLYREARPEMRLRRRRQQCAAGLCLPDRKPDDDRNGCVDAGQIRLRCRVYRHTDGCAGGQ